MNKKNYLEPDVKVLQFTQMEKILTLSEVDDIPVPDIIDFGQ